MLKTRLLPGFDVRIALAGRFARPDADQTVCSPVVHRQHGAVAQRVGPGLGVDHARRRSRSLHAEHCGTADDDLHERPDGRCDPVFRPVEHGTHRQLIQQLSGGRDRLRQLSGNPRLHRGPGIIEYTAGNNYR